MEPKNIRDRYFAYCFKESGTSAPFGGALGGSSTAGEAPASLRASYYPRTLDLTLACAADEFFGCRPAALLGRPKDGLRTLGSPSFVGIPFS